MVSLLALSAVGRLSFCGCFVCSLQLKSADSLQIHEVPLIVAYPGNGGKTEPLRHDCPRTHDQFCIDMTGSDGARWRPGNTR